MSEVRYRPIKKAVFPVAGLGTRFLPATKDVPKEMMTLIDRPLIHHGVDEAVASGCTQIMFVTGQGKESIRRYFEPSEELVAALRERGKTPIRHSRPAIVLHHPRRRSDKHKSLYLLWVRHGEAKRGASAHRPPHEDDFILRLDRLFRKPLQLLDIRKHAVARERAEIPRLFARGPAVKDKGLHIPSRSAAQRRAWS